MCDFEKMYDEILDVWDNVNLNEISKAEFEKIAYALGEKMIDARYMIDSPEAREEWKEYEKKFLLDVGNRKVEWNRIQYESWVRLVKEM